MDPRSCEPRSSFNRGGPAHVHVGQDLRVGQVKRRAPLSPQRAAPANRKIAQLAHRQVDTARHAARSLQGHLGAYRHPRAAERGAGEPGPRIRASHHDGVTRLEGCVADEELTADSDPAHVKPSADNRAAAGRVVDQEDAAIDDRLAEINGQAGQRRLDRRAGQIK